MPNTNFASWPKIIVVNILFLIKLKYSKKLSI